MTTNFAHPDLLANYRVTLLHHMSADGPLYQLDLTGEQMLMRDMIQRMYTDDGHGDGRITQKGIAELDAIRQYAGSGAEPGLASFIPRTAILPAAVVFMASRADLTAQMDYFNALEREDAQLPTW